MCGQDLIFSLYLREITGRIYVVNILDSLNHLYEYQVPKM